MEIIITRQTFGYKLAFHHDPRTRRVTGEDADKIMAMMDGWDGAAVLYGTQPVSAPDPLGSTHDMAALLATCGWELPDDLMALLPPAQEIPQGAVS